MSDPQARLTNLGLQVDVKSPPKVRLTNFVLQVEVGEWYPAPTLSKVLTANVRANR